MDLESRTRCSLDFHKFHSLDTSGVLRDSGPDPKKIAAVKRMDLPQDVETMRKFPWTCETISTDLVHI